MVQKPNAPVEAVERVYKTFRGQEERGGNDGWLITFDNDSDEQNATALINMLQGWEAEPHENCRGMIRISSV